jgi:ABC-type bacteriocin/lantibiotic exporter with double-glycine peptidase domain
MSTTDKEALIHYGSAVTQDDRDAYTDRRRQDMSVMKNEYSRQHEQRILRERLEEQRQRRIFSGLQQAANKRKLRAPVNSLDAQLKRYAPVPMGLPHTSEEWLSESNKHEKNEEAEKSKEMRTIDVVSPKHDKNDEYYFEGTRLFQVQKTNES